MSNNNETNKKEGMCCDAVPQHEKTIEDEIHWYRIRIDEVINERNDLLDKLKREEQRKNVLVATLSEEYQEKVRAFEQIGWYIRRTDAYRNAINEIAEKCHEVLKDGNSTLKTAEQLAKEILDITYRF